MQYYNKQIIPPIIAFAAGFILCANCALAQAGAAADSSRQTDLALTRSLIQEAIRLGVPLYNNGQAEACAAVYRVALHSLVLFAPASVDPQGIARTLRTASSQAPERRAWTLRYALDAIYLATERNSPVNGQSFSIEFSADRSASWYAVNDNVMGGVSRGFFAVTENETGAFTGQLSLQNNGGFSSVRTRVNNGR